jgi:hypothetical protein
MIPWLNDPVEENDTVFPRDWPYGDAANRHTVETFLRYHWEQGLSRHRLAVEGRGRLRPRTAGPVTLTFVSHV